MVGLSIVLESDKATTSTCTSTSYNKKKSAQVINKVITINKKPTSPASPSRSTFCGTSFLDHCFLCKRRLLPCTDIYMYQGDRGFCSEECRCRQIYMDEQNEVKKKTTTSTKTATPRNNNRRENCSLAAMRSSPTSSPSSRKST